MHRFVEQRGPWRNGFNRADVWRYFDLVRRFGEHHYSCLSSPCVKFPYRLLNQCYMGTRVLRVPFLLTYPDTRYGALYFLCGIVFLVWLALPLRSGYVRLHLKLGYCVCSGGLVEEAARKSSSSGISLFLQISLSIFTSLILMCKF